jgi:hypothetical protein
LPAAELIVLCSQAIAVVEVVVEDEPGAPVVVVDVEDTVVLVEVDPVVRVVDPASGATTPARGLSVTRDPAASTAKYATKVVAAVAPSHPRTIRALRTLP